VDAVNDGSIGGRDEPCDCDTVTAAAN